MLKVWTFAYICDLNKGMDNKKTKYSKPLTSQAATFKYHDLFMKSQALANAKTIDGYIEKGGANNASMFIQASENAKGNAETSSKCLKRRPRSRSLDIDDLTYLQNKPASDSLGETHNQRRERSHSEGSMSVMKPNKLAPLSEFK